MNDAKSERWMHAGLLGFAELHDDPREPMAGLPAALRTLSGRMQLGQGPEILQGRVGGRQTF